MAENQKGKFPEYVFRNDDAHRVKVATKNPFLNASKTVEAYCFRCGFQTTLLKQNFEQSAYTEQYATVYLIEGEGIYTDDEGTEYEIRSGSLFERLPGRKHYLRWTSRKITICYLAVPAGIYEGLKLAGTVQTSSPVHQLGADVNITSQLYEIMQGMKSQVNSVSAEVQLKIYRYLLYLHQKIKSFTSPQEQQELMMVEEACYRLNCEVEKQIPVPELLQDVPLSYSRIRQLFSKHLQQSPGNYRISVRIDHAKLLLTEYGKSVKEVASVMNYPDIHTFSRQFKKVTGVPPSNYFPDSLLLK